MSKPNLGQLAKQKLVCKVQQHKADNEMVDLEQKLVNNCHNLTEQIKVAELKIVRI